MADGGQRLLDVIDDVFSSDPNALESFLGGLTSASDLLPSAESVDTVVASLAQSLGADYEVDSPNDTLFDTLEASSTNLTDISQSYVPSDFENASVYGSSNGLSQHLDHQHLTPPTSNAGQSQSFETQTGTINGGSSADINVEVLVNSTLQQQYPNSVCDSTSSFTTLPQQQQQQSIQNMAPSDSFNQNYSHLVDIHTQQQNVSQTPSLSSSSSSSSSNVNTNNTNNNSNSNNNECLQAAAISSRTATNTSNLISSVPTAASTSSSKSNVSASITNTVSNLVTTAAGLVSKFSLQQQQEKEMPVSVQNQSICGVISNAINSVSHLSNSISSTSPTNINLQIQQQAQTQSQQFIVSAAQNINQLVQQQGQAVSFSSMTMGPQLMSSNTNGGLISSVISGGQGGNLMHIQSATGQPQQFLTIEHPTPTLIATGGTAFGTTNLALVSTGGTPTYAVLPTGQQLFSNAIVQPQLQALKNSGQTFFQTASGSIVAANSIHSIQGVQNVNVPSIRAKQQPQLLPKPALNSSVISNLSTAPSSNNIANSWNTTVSSTSDSNGSGTIVVASPSNVGEQQQQSQHSIGVTMANMGQLLQQQTQHLHQVPTNASIVTSVANGSVRFSQPSFTIGNAGGIGQVMVSGMGNINTTMSAPQAQLAGTTFVLNQNQTVQIQQIQTPNGPAYIAVRCPSTTQAPTAQFVSSQIQQEPVPQAPVQPTPQPIQSSQTSVAPVTVHNPINTLQQQTLGSITQHSQQQITIKTEKVDRTQSLKQKQTKTSAIPDSSTEAPPKKKPSKKKKKVTLDLDEILKQSGIGDEDLQDDSCFENTIPNHTPIPTEGTNGFQNQTHTPVVSPIVKPNGSLNKSRNLPVNILPPHVHVLKPTANPPNNKNQRNNSLNSREGAGSSNNKKSTPKKSPPKRKAPPLKKQEPPAKQPTPSPSPSLSPSPAKNKKNSPKSNNSRKKPNPNSSVTKKNSSPSKSPTTKGSANKSSPAASHPAPTAKVPPISVVNNSTTVCSNSSTPGLESAASVGVPPVSTNASTQRIVHTIQLTPQNQQLLRNIQAQITRLVALPKRNENEQTALQKLIYLQQQVIATGTPVPNPASLNNVNTGTNSTPPHSLGSSVHAEDSKIIEQKRAAAKAEEEARARWRKEQFDFLLKRDQDFFVEPDYKTPFTSKQDAVERLMKYHLARDKTEMDFEDFDEEFSDTAVRLLEKFSCMVAKYKSLMLKESMRQVSCAERVMVERTFCNEEKVKLEQDKLLVAQGEILELPSPPSSWAPKLREMVEADMKEIELDSVVNEQVQSAIDSIISCGSNDTQSYQVPEEGEKIEYDAFGVPTSSSSNYGGMNSSSADIDEAVRSILA